MAERRMFAKTIIDSDAFLDMPVTARLLYYDLAMRADDDGFVNSPKKIMRMIGVSQDDMSILIMRKFIIPFDNGIVVIKHWRIHNYIRKDTYNETTYKEEKAMLSFDENKAYTLKSQQCDNAVDGSSTERGRLVDTGKVRLGKDSIGECLKAPTQDDVISYCKERKNDVDAKRFFNYYEARGWEINGKPVKDWKALLRTWESKSSSDPGAKDKRLNELRIKREALVAAGASKEELEVIDLNIQSVKDAMEVS